jgi:transposase
MASLIRVVKNEQVYLYESQSYWDKEKKAPRTKMVYIGKEDPATKEIIPVGGKWTPKASRDYGNVFLLEKISSQIGLTEILREAFPDEWEKLIACVFFEVSEGKPLYLCGTWLENTYVDMLDGLPSQRISELLKSVGENLAARLEFSRLWTEKRGEDEFVVFDITTISSYSKLIESVEWGYNRDKEKLPQINLGMVFGQPSLLPIFYNLYQGSIRDVSTLKNILEFLSDFKLRNVTFLLDKGFYSTDNLIGMRKKGLQFITPLPFTVKQAEELVEKHEKEISDVSNALRVNKQILYCVKDKITVEDYSLNAYVYFDKRKRLEGEEHLLKRIIEAEEKVQDRHFQDKEAVRKYLSQHAADLEKVFDIKKAKGSFVLIRDTGRIEKAIRQMGYVIILSSRSMNPKKIILLYRNKDCVEKCFDNMKNELSTNRLRVHSTESMEGRLFITFLSLILSSWIHKTMREKTLSKKYTLEEIMYELKKLKMIQLQNKSKVLTEITKTQKELFKKLVKEIPRL